MASLWEKMAEKLEARGVTGRKAKELAKGLASVTRVKTPEGLTLKIVERLVKLGVTERKAKELAKSLLPSVKLAIKQKQEKGKKPVHEAATTAVEDAAIDETLAPMVNGHRFRMDLPVIGKEGTKNIELLRVMHGLSSSFTYIVAAVKGEDGIVAVRDFGGGRYNVKFYPTLAYWGKTQDELKSLGAEYNSYCERQWYQRMHFSKVGLEQLLLRLEAEKPKSRLKKAMDRLKSVTLSPLMRSFEYLSANRNKLKSAA